MTGSPKKTGLASNHLFFKGVMWNFRRCYLFKNNNFFMKRESQESKSPVPPPVKPPMTTIISVEQPPQFFGKGSGTRKCCKSTSRGDCYNAASSNACCESHWHWSSGHDEPKGHRRVPGMSTAVDRADEAIAASSTVARRVLKQFKDTELSNVIKYMFLAAETYILQPWR